MAIVLHSEHVEMKETSEKLLKIIITLSGTQLVLNMCKPEVPELAHAHTFCHGVPETYTSDNS